MCGTINPEKVQAALAKKFAETGELTVPECKGSKSCEGACKLTEIATAFVDAMQAQKQLQAVPVQK